MSTDANTAAPSAAPETAPPAAPPDQAAYKAEWFAKAGKPVDSTPAADSSPAQPEVPADAPAADSSSATPEKRPDKRATEHRIPDLLSERARLREEKANLERELAELRSRSAKPATDAPPADSSPATAAPAITYPDDLQSYDAYNAKHPEASYEDYLDARADVRADQRQAAKDAETRARTVKTEHAQRIEARDTSFRERMSKVLTDEPEFFEHMSEDVKRLRPFDAIRDANGRWTEQPSGRHAIAEEILKSETPHLLLRHFTDHPEELKRIAGLEPTALLKEMGKLETRLGGATAPAKTPPKLITDQPEPPTQLGKRPAEPEDPLTAAVISRDQRAYKDAWFRERAAQHGAR